MTNDDLRVLMSMANDDSLAARLALVVAQNMEQVVTVLLIVVGEQPRLIFRVGVRDILRRVSPLQADCLSIEELNAEVVSPSHVKWPGVHPGIRVTGVRRLRSFGRAMGPACRVAKVGREGH